MSEDVSGLEPIESAVIKAAMDCVVAIDENGRIVAFNPAAEATFGHRESEVLGCELAEMLIPQALRDAHHAGMERYLSTGEARMLGQRRVQVEALHKDGHQVPIELTITDVETPTGRCFVAYLRDLTAQRHLEETLERQESALRQAERMTAMGSLLGNVAHELNNPLSALVTQCALLAETAKDERMAKRAERIKRSAERCAAIVKQFLARTRQTAANPRAVDVTGVVGESVELLRYALESSGIEIIIDLDLSLPKAHCDPDQLGQILVNLINNSQQAMSGHYTGRRHKLTISGRATTDGQTIELAIKDSGPGVPADLRGRIFEPFFTTKPVGSGTGIGLAISLSMIKAQGGDLTLAECEDEGACFVLTLPLDAGDMDAEPTAQDSPGRLPHLRPLSILVVEDEPDNRTGLVELLERQGHKATAVDGGHVAAERLRQQWFDVVLSDIRMPDGDGIQLAEQIRTDASHPLSRFAFITGDHLGPHARDYLGHHDVPYLTKPFSAMDLNRLLAALIAND